MFTAKDKKSTLDPYFRIAYFLQVVAAGAMAAGMFLTWWGGGTGDSLTGFDILSRSVDRLRGRSPLVVLEPLFMLWFAGPVIVVSLLRGMTGILVVPVWYRKVAFATWALAAFALAHFFINYGHNLASSSPLKDGNIRPGFWLTTSSAMILGVLILTESLIREPDRPGLSRSRSTKRWTKPNACGAAII